MYTRRGVVTQSGGDAFTTQTIDTNLTADGKSGWEIMAFSGYWANGETGAAADYDANLVLAAQPLLTTFDLDEEIYRLNWACANTGGVAVAFPMSLVKREMLIQPRVTVQPILWVHASTAVTGLTNQFYWELNYNIVKLSDLEVLRLLQGGV